MPALELRLHRKGPCEMCCRALAQRGSLVVSQPKLDAAWTCCSLRDLQEIVTETQSRAQFSMWAVMASPLLISGNPYAFSDFTFATYANAKVIAVNQVGVGAAAEYSCRRRRCSASK